MTAIAQRDLFTRRYRRVRVLEPSEVQIQISLVAQLKLRLWSHVTLFHVPNGELRDKRHAAKLKAMGVLPGVADLVFLWPEANELRVLFLELKARGRGLTAVQKVFRDRVRATGCYFECVDSIDNAVRVARKYELLRT